MLNWKKGDPKYGDVESVLGIAFREEMPELAKQLSDASGQYQHGKTCTDGKYEYKCKIVISKTKNQTFIFVERKLASSASPNPDGKPANADYQARQDAIQKNHDERMALDREKLAFEKEKLEWEKNVFGQNQALLLQVVDMTHQVQLMVKAVVELKDLFKTAASMYDQKPAAEVSTADRAGGQ